MDEKDYDHSPKLYMEIGYCFWSNDCLNPGEVEVQWTTHKPEELGVAMQQQVATLYSIG